jgi:hypothetical protein
MNPPTEIDVSEEVPITLRKVLHNNGPYQVETPWVNITKTATAPTGCSVDPPGGAAHLALPYGVDVVHDEVFTIHCEEPSTHGPFTFHNEIEPDMPYHVRDPIPGNNSADTELSVNALADVDLAVSQEWFPTTTLPKRR